MKYAIKSVEAEIKTGADGRTVEGYASTFGNVDRHNETIAPGAFSKSVAERYPRNLIKLFFEHYEPVGKMAEEPREDSTGLYVVGVTGTTDSAKRAYQLAADGIASHLSIGYVVKDQEQPAASGKSYTTLKEIDLWEVSIVVFPANDLAEISAVKSALPSDQDAIEYVKTRHQIVSQLLSSGSKSGYLSDATLAQITDAKAGMEAAALALRTTALQGVLRS